MKTRTFRRGLYHLGTLNPQDKGLRGSSMEGNGLSVSECPDAWRSIAKLGGMPTWKLHKPGNRFLDYHSLSAADHQRIRDYGLENGWAVLETVWIVTRHDSELDCEIEMCCKTEAEAFSEAGEDDDPASAVSSRLVPVATQAMADWLGFTPAEFLVPSMLATLYADRVLDLDGVFWDDLLDVPAFSAPRAVIAARKLDSWSIGKL